MLSQIYYQHSHLYLVRRVTSLPEVIPARVIPTPITSRLLGCIALYLNTPGKLKLRNNSMTNFQSGIMTKLLLHQYFWVCSSCYYVSKWSLKCWDQPIIPKFMGYSYHRGCLLILLKLFWLRFLETLQWEFSDYKSKGSQTMLFTGMG